ncbi:hypothetical protein DSO57_1005076 [Entomophthora muscae]|uniref:Uncharacterized protein n=1 Tax=Entomophthora muscae TaxID=34485 RepID=A0ACC2RMT0_9FUNG|nr:hypothetical protein DSO57_1005076 [Entomophthora muscae]
MASLKKLLAMFPPIKYIYPGHGPAVIDGKSKVIQYIKHRQEREDAIVNILKSEPPSEVKSPKYFNDQPAYSSTDLVGIMYTDYPDSVLRQAQHSVTLHLKKLLVDEKVRQVELPGICKEAYWQWCF